MGGAQVLMCCQQDSVTDVSQMLFQSPLSDHVPPVYSGGQAGESGGGLSDIYTKFNAEDWDGPSGAPDAASGPGRAGTDTEWSMAVDARALAELMDDGAA